jgi:energy-coupling factor transport system ATP-binding protein
MDDVAGRADKVIVMDRGKVVMQGPPEEIFARSDELTALGLGLPEVTHLMHELKLRGLSISDRLYSYDDAADVIAGALER